MRGCSVSTPRPVRSLYVFATSLKCPTDGQLRICTLSSCCCGLMVEPCQRSVQFFSSTLTRSAGAEVRDTPIVPGI